MGAMLMNNSVMNFNKLIEEHPQLKEKSLVDFINGIEVIDDHIRVRDNINQSFSGRLWDNLTGQSHLRQQTIDQNVSHSLDAVSNWLQFLQHSQIESDLAITKVAEKLKETRVGVMRLQEKHHHLAQQVEGLLINFSQLDTKFSQLSARLEQVDAGRLASQQLDAVFDKWQAGRLNHYPAMIRLYFVFDELHWGDFGNYCRQYNQEHEINRLIQQAKDKALIQLHQDMNIPVNQVWLWHDSLANDIQALSQEHQQLLAYLSDDAMSDLTPMLWAVNRLATGKNNLPSCNQVPIILNIDNTINRFAFDFGARNAQQRF